MQRKSIVGPLLNLNNQCVTGGHYGTRNSLCVSQHPFLSVSFILAESKEVIKLIKKVRVSTFSC